MWVQYQRRPKTAFLPSFLPIYLSTYTTTAYLYLLQAVIRYALSFVYEEKGALEVITLISTKWIQPNFRRFTFISL